MIINRDDPAIHALLGLAAEFERKASHVTPAAEEA
jgi:hypothetical protein